MTRDLKATTAIPTVPELEVPAPTRNAINAFDQATATVVPFADASYLFKRTLERYVQRLRMLTGHIGVAGKLADALLEGTEPEMQRVIGDPVVRAAINEGLAQVRFGRSTFSEAETEEILQIALGQLLAKDEVSVLQRGVHERIRFNAGQSHGWFWSNNREEDAPARFFRKLYGTLEAGKSVLATPTAQERENISKAISILNATLPKVAQSALDHVYLLGVCDVPDGYQSKTVHFNSFTTIKIPGTIFLGRDLIRDPWRTAEAILHESLHEKLYCFQHTHSLFSKEADVNVTAKVCSLWNRPSAQKNNWWPLSRAVFALHVYVHLAVLFEAMQKQCDRLEALFGARDNYDLARWKRRAFDRAHYLSQQISSFSQDLGPAGHALVAWLAVLMNENDAAPPEPGSYVHLLLDLYERETPQLAAKYRRTPSMSAETECELQRRIHAEQGLACRILAAVSASSVPAIHEDASGSAPSTFQTTRKTIVNLLGGISLSQCGLPVFMGSQPMTVAEVIEALVLTPEKYAA